MSDGDIYLIKIITDREIIRNFQTTTFTVILWGMFFLNLNIQARRAGGPGGTFRLRE